VNRRPPLHEHLVTSSAQPCDAYLVPGGWLHRCPVTASVVPEDCRARGVSCGFLRCSLSSLLHRHLILRNEASGGTRSLLMHQIPQASHLGEHLIFGTVRERLLNNKFQ
jgi:hypothetical protein